MRIYAVADIHGQMRRIEAIIRNIAAIHPDVLVIAGDITGHAHDAATVAKLNDVTVPVLAIHGNIDAQDLEQRFHDFNNIRSLHLQEVIKDDISFVGVGGGIAAPFLTFLNSTERRSLKAVARLMKRDTVLVAHAPPWGALDKGFSGLHGGSRDLSDLILEKQPRVLICGHIHENRGVDYLGETLVVNCSMGHSGAGALIDISPGQPVKASLLE
jgi:Icc-related predicted phosphoesterase